MDLPECNLPRLTQDSADYRRQTVDPSFSNLHLDSYFNEFSNLNMSRNNSSERSGLGTNSLNEEPPAEIIFLSKPRT